MGADVVTARAVAPMGRLVGWCLPLLRRGGRMLALKGDSADEELASVERELPQLGASAWGVVEVGESLGNAATRVIRIDLGSTGFRTARPERRSRRGPRG
jgi:16S rRNA (guanine527-N7)-methyltransferase